MRVIELFSSIQGESTSQGFPTTFVRFSGCNLRCSYCDTTYAYEGGRECSVQELLDEVQKRGLQHVALTGGEPLLQEGVEELVSRLAERGHVVLVETNGSVDIGGVSRASKVIVDLKTPGSGMSHRMDLGNLGRLRPQDELKFVLTGREDYAWARQFVRERGLEQSTVLFSPVFGVFDPGELARLMLEDRLPVRLHLQLHKYVFGPARRGV
jgi:7-carboxy-7-deazaguanine synthase